jgi:hypothetical protein
MFAHDLCHSRIEYCRLHIEYLWNVARREPQGRTIDLKKIEHSDSLNIQFSIPAFPD